MGDVLEEDGFVLMLICVSLREDMHGAIMFL